MMPVALKSRMSKNNMRFSKSKGSSTSKHGPGRLSKKESFMMIPPMSFEEKCRRYRAIFDSIDIDGSGTLDPEELRQAVVALGMEEDQVIEVFGVTADTSLGFDQFVASMEAFEERLGDELQREAESDEDSEDSGEGAQVAHIDIATATAYRRLFEELDVRRAGHLTADDLQTYIRNLSLREASMSSEELNFLFALVEEADASPDGFIDIEGFADVAELHSGFIEDYKVKAIPGGFRNSKYDSTGSAGPTPRQNTGELAEYRAVFNQFDRNGNGIVSDEDVTAMMNQLGRVPTEEESEFLFELLQLVGEDGFSFEDFTELMREGPEGLADLGRNISAWKTQQTNAQQVKSKKLVRANVSRMGLRTAIQREDSRIQSRNSARLERINQRLSRGDSMQKGTQDGFGAGFSFLPSEAANARQAGTAAGGVPMYPAHPQQAVGATHMGSAYGGMGFASAMLSPLELLRYQAVFNALDLDKDGRISFSEMTISTKGVTGRQPTDQEVRDFLLDADTDQNGTIEFEEFVVIMQRTKRALGRMSVANPEIARAATERKLKKYRTVFESFDLNKDGVVTPMEFRQTLEQLGRPANERAIQNMFQKFDKSNSGVLCFEDFVPMLDEMVTKELSL